MDFFQPDLFALIEVSQYIVPRVDFREIDLVHNGRMKFCMGKQI